MEIFAGIKFIGLRNVPRVFSQPTHYIQLCIMYVLYGALTIHLSVIIEEMGLVSGKN